MIGIFSKSKKNKYLVSKFYEQNEFSILKNKNNVKYFKCYDFKIKYPKHIKFLNLKEKFLYPTQNQLYAVKQALECSKGQYIFLLDGDDYFHENKLNVH